MECYWENFGELNSRIKEQENDLGVFAKFIWTPEKMAQGLLMKEMSVRDAALASASGEDWQDTINEVNKGNYSVIRDELREWVESTNQFDIFLDSLTRNFEGSYGYVFNIEAWGDATVDTLMDVYGFLEFDAEEVVRDMRRSDLRTVMRLWRIGLS